MFGLINYNYSNNQGLKRNMFFYNEMSYQVHLNSWMNNIYYHPTLIYVFKKISLNEKMEELKISYFPKKPFTFPSNSLALST